MRENASHLGIKISALKENLEGCRKRYDVYKDIYKTYEEISKGDYISDLVEEGKAAEGEGYEEKQEKGINYSLLSFGVLKTKASALFSWILPTT